MIRSALEKAATVVMVAIMTPLWLLACLLEDDDGPKGTDASGPFGRQRPNHIFRSQRRGLARIPVDPDRLEEWVRANYDDETPVKITTKHGTDVFTRGEHVTTECPVCGEQPRL